MDAEKALRRLGRHRNGAFLTCVALVSLTLMLVETTQPSASSPSLMAPTAEPHDITLEQPQDLPLTVSDKQEPLEVSNAFGKVSLATRDVGKIKASQRAAGNVAALVIPATDYETDGYVARTVADDLRPYAGTSNSTCASGAVHLVAGVCKMIIDGVVFDHPVAQAQYALAELDRYRRTGNPANLEHAIAQATRWTQTAVVARGGWFLPYDFDFAVHNDSLNVLKAPWYSDMAEGQALSVLVRIHQVTQDPQWAIAADNVFTAMALPPAPGMPWVTWVDSNRNLWLDEYPRPGVTNSERVLNGHMYATYGLFDYVQLTGNTDAAAMFDGAVTTVARTALVQFRVPGWASKYSLFHGISHLRYHQTHINQLTKMQTLTGVFGFAHMAEVLRGDYPSPGVSGTVVFSAGRHTGHKFDANGVITATKKATLTRQSAAPGDKRARLKGKRIKLHITAGIFAGYWVKDLPGVSYMRGPKQTLTFSPTRKVTLEPGAYAATKYTDDRLTATIKFTASRSTSAPFDSSAYVSGRFAVHVTAGPMAGAWLPAGNGVHLS